MAVVNDIEVVHIVAVKEGRLMPPWVLDPGRRAVQRIKAILDSAIALGLRDAARGNPADAKLVGKGAPDEAPEGRALSLPRGRRRAGGLPRASLPGRGEPALRSVRYDRVRREAVRGAARALGRVDLEKALWVIPALRTKTSKEHVVPLSSVALEVLRLQAAWRVGAMVFPRLSGDTAVP